MMDFEIKDKYTVADFRRIIEILRAPGGCPWDAEQTHESIRNNVLEEAYEVAGAIDEGSTENLKEELGDLLMQVIFHARMEEEKGGFDLDDVADGACKKLVFRHPHVFGGAKCESTEEVLRTWEEAKKAEKKQKTPSEAMAGVTKTLPALVRAEKVQKKAADAGFEKLELGMNLVRLQDRAAELFAGSEDPEQTLGELLYHAVRAARMLDIDPEKALHRACDEAIACCEKAESL